MKKLLVASLLFTPCVGANPYLYTGGTLLFGNVTDWDDPNVVREDATNDFGYSLIFGAGQRVYSFINFGADIHAGVEVEFQDFGDVTFTNVANSGQSLSLEGYNVFVNGRAKFSPNNSPVYAGLIGGIGYHDAKYQSTLLRNGESKETSTVYQVGVELGVQLKQLDLSAGYRYQVTDYDGVDISIKGLALGAVYNF